MKKILYLIIIILFPIISFSQYQKHNLSRQDSADITKYNIAIAEHTERGNLKETSRFLNMIADLYWEHNYFDEAVSYYTHSLELNHTLGNENGIAMINSSLALIYTDKGEFETALDYFQITLSTRKANKETVGTISALINISVVLNNLSRYNEAAKYLEEALDLAREMNDPVQMCSCYGQLSETYEKAGNSEKSMYYYGLYKSFHEMVQEKKVTKSREEVQLAIIRERLALSEKEKKEMELMYKEKELKETEDELELTSEELASTDAERLKVLETLTKTELTLEVIKREAEIQQLEAQAEIEAKRKTILIGAFGLVFIVIVAVLLLIGFILNRKKNIRLAFQNSEIIAHREEIIAQSEELLTKSEEIEKAYKKLEDAHKKITASISYAEMIQRALLSKSNEHSKFILDEFILFKPRDVVSGDFYWQTEVDGYIFITAVDCTGHGVPGAFLSMIGVELLNQIVKVNKIYDPAQILTDMNIGIQKALNQEETNNQDGMDMALCTIDKKNKKILFAGAKNPLIIIQNNELQHIRGDKSEIGGLETKRRRKSQTEDFVPYTTKEFEIKQDTYFYLFSDGFQDQFGGAKNSKFKIKNLKTLLLEIHQKPMNEQKQILDETIINWQEEEVQVDDILLIGVKI